MGNKAAGGRCQSLFLILGILWYPNGIEGYLCENIKYLLNSFVGHDWCLITPTKMTNTTKMTKMTRIRDKNFCFR